MCKGRDQVLTWTIFSEGLGLCTVLLFIHFDGVLEDAQPSDWSTFLLLRRNAPTWLVRFSALACWRLQQQQLRAGSSHNTN